MSELKLTKPVVKETVTLATHHTHGGRDCKPGDKIDVTPAQKQWLMQRGIVKNENPI